MCILVKRNDGLYYSNVSGDEVVIAMSVVDWLPS